LDGVPYFGRVFGGEVVEDFLGDCGGCLFVVVYVVWELVEVLEWCGGSVVGVGVVVVFGV